jgi:hypothetical protein
VRNAQICVPCLSVSRRDEREEDCNVSEGGEDEEDEHRDHGRKDAFDVAAAGFLISFTLMQGQVQCNRLFID